MLWSEENDKIAEALVSFGADISGLVLAKKDVNTYYNSKYCSLPDCLNPIRVPLNKNGLALVQSPTITRHDNGYVEITVTTRIVHISGQWVQNTVSFFLDCDNNLTIHKCASAITMLRRYAVCCMLGLAPEEEDDDGVSTVQNNIQTGRQNIKRNVPSRYEHSSEDDEVSKIISELRPEVVKVCEEHPEEANWENLEDFITSYVKDKYNYTEESGLRRIRLMCRYYWLQNAISRAKREGTKDDIEELSRMIDASGLSQAHVRSLRQKIVQAS